MPTIADCHTLMKSLWALFTDEIFQQIAAAAETFCRPSVDLVKWLVAKLRGLEALWTTPNASSLLHKC